MTKKQKIDQIKEKISWDRHLKSFSGIVSPSNRQAIINEAEIVYLNDEVAELRRQLASKEKDLEDYGKLVDQLRAEIEGKPGPCDNGGFDDEDLRRDTVDTTHDDLPF